VIVPALVFLFHVFELGGVEAAMQSKVVSESRILNLSLNSKCALSRSCINLRIKL